MVLIQVNVPHRLNVLVLSEAFPNPTALTSGIFVQHQVSQIEAYCDQVVVSPIRVFPHLRLWKEIYRPKRLVASWQDWWTGLKRIPSQGEISGIPVFYPRYTSPPKQFFHGLWGFFAYPFLRQLLYELQSIRKFDLIHAHYASPCGLIALLAQRWMKIPIILSVHGGDVTFTARQNLLGAAIIRWVFENVDAILTNSTWTARQVIHFGGDPRKVHIVRLGGNAPAGIDLSTGSRSKDGKTTLLSVGNLYPTKGHIYVLYALRRLIAMGYSLRYVIVGDGPEKARLIKLVNELDLENEVSFEGAKPHGEVWSYFEASDIFVLPSWVEGFGLVFTEALGLGKPAIGCIGAGGPEDLKVLGDCIELVQPRDVESLVRALKNLLDDPQRARQMGETGRQIVAEHYTWERNAITTLQVYRQVLNTHQACVQINSQ